ncbi:hypothetical protein ACWGIA_17225 [Streptomyces bobili]|uniref:hypothetical protein n=1 Tax=Streptomyces bobili TaxID=67280 RepID=UPI0036E1778B
MTIHGLVLLMLMLFAGMMFASLAGFIAFGIARWTGAPVSDAINRASLVFFSAMTLIIALFGVFLPAVT